MGARTTSQTLPLSKHTVVLETERIGSTTAGIVLIYSLSFCEALTFLARSHADVSYSRTWHVSSYPHFV